MTLRNRLIAAFLASTLLPLGATVWITTTLLDRSLRYATTGELDRLSRTLENTAKQFYQRERDALKQDALAGRARPTTIRQPSVASGPSPSGRSGRAARPSGSACLGRAASAWTTCGASTVRRRPGVEIYSRDLGGVSMEQLSTEVRRHAPARRVRSMRAICGADSR